MKLEYLTLAIALTSLNTHAATLVVTRTGQVQTLHGPIAKTQAFCTANPNALVQLDTTLVPAAVDGRINIFEGATQAFSVQGAVSAYCGINTQEPTRRALISLQFEVLAGGSASAADGTASATQLTFNSVPVFLAAPVSQTTSGTMSATADAVIEPDETLRYGLRGGTIIENDPANPNAGNLAVVIGSGATLVTFVIKDGAPIGDSTIRLLPNDDVALDIAASLDTICKKQNLDGDLLLQCQALRTALGQADGAGAASIFRALGAEEAAAESSSIIENRAGSQQDRINTRLGTLHGSAARKGNSMTTSFTWNDVGLPTGFAQSEQDNTGGGLLDAKLGGFLIADGGKGDRESTTREDGFDYDRYGLSGGLDYRFTDAFVAGFALGFNRYEADLAGAGGALDAKVNSLSLYSSYSMPNGAYFDATLGFSDFDFSTLRLIQYNAGGRSENRRARGDYSAEQLSGTLAIGWPLVYGAWSLTPSASIEYSRTDSDSFTETGAGALNLRILGQDAYSTVGALNFQANRSISIERGVLVPYFGASYYFEQRNESNPTLSFFPADVDRTRIFIRSDAADTRFGSLGAGITWYLPSGLQAYLDYRRSFGLRGFSQNGLSLGLRLEF